jgi:hypothetical protein
VALGQKAKSEDQKSCHEDTKITEKNRYEDVFDFSL